MPPPADYVLVNGRVRTVNAVDARAAAVAVSGRWITVVGSDAEVRPQIGRGTDVIDLRGREVVPGFNDAHHHFGSTLARSVRCGPDAVGTIADVQAAVRRAAAELPAGTWIRARGYDHHRLAERRHPTRRELDAAAPEHPVVLVRTCGHMGVVNSRALQVLGIDETAPDPPGGAYDRVDGRLAGVLFEKALYPAVRAASATRAELVAAMRDRARACLAMGWTTLQDPGARNPDLLPALIEAEREGQLPLRVRAFVELSGMEPHGLALFRGGLISGFGNDRLRIGPCKLMVDGSSSGPTAATRRPYASQPAFSGLLQMSQEELDALVREGRRTGFQMTMHAVGDRAIEMCLDAFARAGGSTAAGDARDRVEHCAMCPPDLVRRVRAQQVIPVVQPTFLWDFGDGYLRDYGAERGAAMFPVRDFLDAGVVVAGSTDHPVSRPEPLFGIQQAVTRLTRTGQVCGPAQRVGVAEAVRLFTLGSAYAAREERILGSIEPGKLADLVVLRQGLEDVAPTEIAGIDIDLVMVDGEVALGR